MKDIYTVTLVYTEEDIVNDKTEIYTIPLFSFEDEQKAQEMVSNISSTSYFPGCLEFKVKKNVVLDSGELA